MQYFIIHSLVLSMIFKISEIEELYTLSNLRKNNGCISKAREKILESSLKGLLTKYEHKSNFIHNTNANLRLVMKDTFGDFPKIKLYPKGGRKYDHDFELHLFSFKSEEEYSVFKLEYKVVSKNNMSIFDYPQLLSLSTESVSARELLNCSYTEFFYENYLDNVCSLMSAQKPLFEEYHKQAKSTSNINSCKLFSNIEEYYDVHKKKLALIAKESFKTFIQHVQIDLKKIFEMFVERNRDKYILFQNGDSFSMENCNKIFNIDTLVFEKLEKLDDSVIIHTNSQFKIHLLFRWKNKQCFKNPAMDFKLKRYK
jgi:hypothetical protein